MKVKSALLGLAAVGGGLLMSATVASADGYSAPARYVPAPTWTGCYVGIEGGWAWGHSDAKNQNINAGPPVSVTTTTLYSYNMDGGMIGGTFGCNLQSSGGIVLGIESDVSWIDKSGKGNDLLVPGFTGQTREHWLSTTRLRLGHSFGNFLLYGTAGAAFADAEFTECNTVLAGCLSQDKWRIGVVYGGGAEWKFDRNWSAKVEYLHVDFENQQYFTPVTPNALGITEKAGGVTLNDDIVRVGINYKFDRREAVPLK